MEAVRTLRALLKVSALCQAVGRVWQHDACKEDDDSRRASHRN